MAIGIRDIAIADQYQGNPGLGSSLDGVVNVDIRPIMQLAQYTYYYNKNVYEQQQKDAEEKAKQLAAVTAYDLNTAIPKDREIIQKKWDDLYAYVQKNPTVLDYKNNPKGWLEYNKKKSDFENDLSGAKVRSITYMERDKQVAEETSVDLKKLKKRELDEEANSTDLRTPLRVSEKYDSSLPQMPKADGIKIPITINHPNYRDDEEHEVWNGEAAKAKGNLFSIGLKKPIDTSTPEGKRRLIEKNNNFWVQGSEIFNSALPSYKDANGNVDESKIKGLPKDLVDLAKKTNVYSSQKNAEIASGFYGNLLKPYPIINWQDGMSADELAIIADYATWGGDKVTRKSAQTDNAIQYANLDLERQRISLAWADHNLNKEKLAKTNSEDLLAADGVLREVADIINAGDHPENYIKTVSTADKKSHITFQISEPTLLQKFGNIDKDGNVNNVPDEARFNKETGEVDLIYFKRKGIGKIQTIDRNNIENRKTLNQRTWVNLVAQRSFGGQERGAANQILQEVITKNGGNLYNIAKQLGGQQIVAPQTSIQSGKTYQYKGKQYTESQLSAAAQQSGMTLEEYKKQLGLQ